MEKVPVPEQLTLIDIRNKPLEDLDPAVAAEQAERLDRMIHMNDIWINGEWVSLGC
jgi:hypothetical protein